MCRKETWLFHGSSMAAAPAKQAPCEAVSSALRAVYKVQPGSGAPTSATHYTTPVRSSSIASDLQPGSIPLLLTLTANGRLPCFSSGAPSSAQPQLGAGTGASARRLGAHWEHNATEANASSRLGSAKPGRTSLLIRDLEAATFGGFSKVTQDRAQSLNPRPETQATSSPESITESTATTTAASRL
ncbi:uncharacterized protein L3040_008728 [Drepanopeziza brunnea f. sp. 'multigermtubi']|uniref:uncharacterized protein n=1 Tax=Drepanopeziza brunnea f. sp. 'multigermtubi' TaxID=698441 RepID=UPI0023894F2E|nr:hypothetical protein L3040_008728 [Drepanopeziza brunnea f. sp. 'multigermtubi']